jgi:hypothetical protein
LFIIDQKVASDTGCPKARSVAAPGWAAVWRLRLTDTLLYDQVLQSDFQIASKMHMQSK